MQRRGSSPSRSASPNLAVFSVSSVSRRMASVSRATWGYSHSMGDKARTSQKSQPKKGKPIDIRVPNRTDFDRLLKRAEKPKQLAKL